MSVEFLVVSAGSLGRPKQKWCHYQAGPWPVPHDAMVDSRSPVDGFLLCARGDGHRPAHVPPAAMRWRAGTALNAGVQRARSLPLAYFCQRRDLLGSVACFTWLAG